MTNYSEHPAVSLVIAFFSALDRRDHAFAAGLLAPQGTWLRQGKILTGPAEAHAALDARPVNRATCHLVTNVRLESKDEAHVAVTYYLTAFEAITDNAGTSAEPRLAAILECQDQLVYAGDIWHIVDKRNRRMMPPAMAASAH
ncbi:nuclear transport factor 2 family protein [Polaromonas sp. OV174]|uniref:nuclear transport factor 2 family protein n=1 Tax=Polaromonas sp. OV174 TaxID=1855300 RepID=UPI00210139B3|nr:nuclear transport factor 2 family protein [Polaromonas sp. OV174]